MISRFSVIAMLFIVVLCVQNYGACQHYKHFSKYQHELLLTSPRFRHSLTIMAWEHGTTRIQANCEPIYDSNIFEKLMLERWMTANMASVCCNNLLIDMEYCNECRENYHNTPFVVVKLYKMLQFHVGPYSHKLYQSLAYIYLFNRLGKM